MVQQQLHTRARVNKPRNYQFTVSKEVLEIVEYISPNATKLAKQEMCVMGQIWRSSSEMMMYWLTRFVHAANQVHNNIGVILPEEAQLLIREEYLIDIYNHAKEILTAVERLYNAEQFGGLFEE